MSYRMAGEFKEGNEVFNLSLLAEENTGNGLLGKSNFLFVDCVVLKRPVYTELLCTLA